MPSDQQPDAEKNGAEVGRQSASESIDLPGWSMDVRVASAESGGRLTVIEGRMAPHLPGPAPHVHAAHDETFVVMAGRLRFRVGSHFRTLGPGETVFAGRQLPHGFGNPYDEPARYVVVLTPSGYEEYFRKVADHVADTGNLPTASVTARLMREHDTILADPLADPAA
jgi:quercetin dioxygenase-like cupin family protein